MCRSFSAVLAAVLFTTLVATPTASSWIQSESSNADPWSSDLIPSWRDNAPSKNGPSTIDWNDKEYRLPGDLLPTVYTLQMFPFLEVGNFTTDGYVEIFVNCVKNTKSIVLNSVDITINRLSITVIDVASNSPLALVGYQDQQSTLQKIVIQTADTLKSGKRYKISMKFTSILNDRLDGFYRSSYVENGVTKYLATTHMEAADARRAFPCFDEPNMKARFSIILGRKKSWMASSNMQLIGTNPMVGMPDYVWDYFETTPIMSSYLVAMMVSEFVSTPSDSSLSNVRFRVLTRPDLQEQTEYAADVGPRILEYFETFFGVDYPLVKQDMAAVPDFGPGAMENWGHMNFRENYLCIDDETTTAAGKQRVAEVIAHELAHQWFGDLVTMDWWNIIWLNEGFARYLQYHGTDAVEPSYRMHELFVVNTLQRVFAADSLQSTHPMSSPVLSSHVFDTIEYDKGASVLRMCAHFLGEETFRRGLNLYLNRKAYSNALEEDLWNTLEFQAAAEGVILPASLVKIMGSWTQTSNYPLINVTRTYTGKDGALVEQERYLLPNSDGTTNPKTQIWWVPLTYTHDFSSKPTTAWLSSKNKKLATLVATPDQWVIFNVDQAGFYRVAYDAVNYGLIADQLIADHEKISLMNRAQLLDDAFTLAKIDKISYKSALDLTLYMNNEKEYVPWRSVLDELNYIDIMLYGNPEHVDWKKHMTNLVTPYYELVGFQETPTDAHLTILSRTDALNWACKLKVADCVTNVQSQYAALMAQPDMMLSPNQKNFILNMGVENSGKAEWNFAFEQYRLTDSNDYLVAMTYSRDSGIIYDLLNKMLDPDQIRSEDVDTLFVNLAANPLGNTMALSFLTQRWNDIEKALGTSHFVFFFRSLCDRLNKEDQYKQMVDLRNAHTEVLGESATVQQGLDVIRVNIEWMSLNQYEIGQWLILNPWTTTKSPTTTTTGITTTTESSASGSTSDSPPVTSTQSGSSGSTTETDSSTEQTVPSSSTTKASTTTSNPSSGSNIQPYFALTLLIALLMGR